MAKAKADTRTNRIIGLGMEKAKRGLRGWWPNLIKMYFLSKSFKDNE